MDVISISSQRKTIKKSTRKRMRLATNKCWITDEEIAIAQYLAAKPYLGKDQAKETLSQYQKRMLKELNLTDCDVKRLKNKVMNMEKKYEKVRKWVSEVGQGIREENPHAFQDIVRNLCHYYYILDERVGSQKINTLYQRPEGIVTVSSDSSVGNTPTSSPSCLEMCDTVHYDDETSNTISDAGDCSEDGGMLIVGTPTITSVKNRFQKYDALRTDSDRLSGANSRTSSAVDKLASIYNSKCESRFEIEKQKLEWQKYVFVKSKEMEMEKLQLQRETELEKVRLNSEVEIRKIALEEKKLKLEFLKLKCLHPDWPDEL